ncbi:MAG: hypothetical protein OHK0038_15310 [Flammeovirgaceae bacterium]
MKLYLDSYGVGLGVENEMFVVNFKNGESKKFAAHKVSTIFLTKGTYVTTDAIVLALKNDVKIFFLDKLERIVGQIWNNKFGSISTIRKNQALFVHSIKSLEWIKSIAIQKIQSQYDLLTYFYNIFPQNKVLYEKTFETQQKIIANIRNMNTFESWNNQSWASTIRGFEGNSSKEYFKCLSAILPIYYQFDERSRKPAKDAFNCMLNYTYGILYSIIESTLIQAGIDPFVGVLHADEYNKPTMVFDFIEPFRVWADETVMQLFLNNLVENDFFEPKDNGIWLSKKGKFVLIDAFDKKMEENIIFNHKPRKRITHLELKAQHFAQELLNFKD